METQNGLCCGIVEIEGINRSPKAVIVDVVEDVFDGCETRMFDKLRQGDAGFAHVIFTSASARRDRPAGYGTRLRDYIASQGLGRVTQSVAGLNHNSRRFVTVYVWTVNKEALVTWSKKNNCDMTNHDLHARCYGN